MRSKVSIILPIYNTPINLLKRAVESALYQTYSDVELIMVDDCSPEVAVSEYLGTIHSTANCDILVHRKDKNGGVSDSLNLGVQLATGEYYCILDHDDYLEPDYVDKMISCAEKNNADLVVGGMKQVDENGVVIAAYPRNPSMYMMESYPWMSAVNLARMIRRSIVIDNGITYPVGAWTEDIIFSAKVYPFVKVVATLPYEGYVNYINPGSSSRSASYYALRIDQIPLEDIKEIIIRNNKERYPYISGLMNNEMMMIGYMLTAFSDKADKTRVKQVFLRYSKELNCTCGELREYNSFVRGSGFGVRLFEIIFNITNRFGMMSLGYLFTGIVVRLYYKRVRK